MRATSVGLTLLVGVGLSPYGAWAGPPPGDDLPTSELKDHHRHHQHGGIPHFVEMGLDTLGEAEAETPQVEKLEDELHACMEPVEDNEKAVLLMIADGVAAGAVDAAKVEAGVAKLKVSAGLIHDCVAGPLNQLHSTLSPVERAELGDKVQAHWEVWRHVNHDAEAGGREPGSRLADLARELSLTGAQVEKLSPALRTALAGQGAKLDAERIKGLVQKFATDFAGDAFDARTVKTNTTADLTAHGTMRMALFYETVAPLLTPAQRTTLAGHLREHASHHAEVPAP